MQCYDSEGNSNDYHCEYTFINNYGHYVWCGKGKHGQYKIKKSDIQTTNKFDSHIIQIKFNLNSHLAKQTQWIEIYDKYWGLLGYNVGSIIGGKWTWVFKINSNLVNTELTVLFLQDRDLTEEDKARLKVNPLMRLPKRKIYSITIKVPELKKINSNDVCCSCLKKFEPNDSTHITSCSHKIHNACLFDYFESNKLVSENNCTDCNTNNIQLPKCPVCNNIDLIISLI